MKLPEDALAILEEFWAHEYESDYWRFIKLGELKIPEKRSNGKELAAISSI
jgi:hypothetical protein